MIFASLHTVYRAPAGSLQVLGLRLASVAALLLPLSACSTIESLNPFGGGEKYETHLLPDVPAETLYNQGLLRLQRNDSTGAVKKFGDVEKQFPFSQWSKKALLMTTYAHYSSQAYDEAIGSANRFGLAVGASKSGLADPSCQFSGNLRFAGRVFVAAGVVVPVNVHIFAGRRSDRLARAPRD